MIKIFSSLDDASQNDLGDNTKKDQFFLEITGLDEIDFGNVDRETCIQSVNVGVLRGPDVNFEEDYTPCVAHQFWVT